MGVFVMNPRLGSMGSIVLISCLLTVFALSLPPSVHATFEYQSNPDVYGCFSFTNDTLCNQTFFDDDFSTYYNGTGEGGYVYMRYAFGDITGYERAATQYQLKVDNITQNLTIPLACWGYPPTYPNSVLFNLYENGILGDGTKELACGVTGGSEISMVNFTEMTMYEEDMFKEIILKVTLHSPQNTTYYSPQVSLDVSANDITDTWWYSIDGGANTTFTPNTTITGTEGAHHIEVYANDSVGEIGGAVIDFSNYIPPQISINAPQNLSYNDTFVAFNFTQVEDVPAVLWYTFPQESWPMFMLDTNNTGLSTNFNPSSPINVWSYDTQDEIRAGAAVSDGVVYFGSDRDDFRAVDLNGTERWSLDLNSDVRSTPAIVDGVIYVGSRDTDLYAIDVNGTIRWQYSAGNDLDSSPTVVDGVVYIGSRDYDLYAIYTNGTLKWQFSTGNEVYSTPAVVGDAVYFGSNDNNFYSVDINGTERWNYTTGGQVRSSPSYVDGVIYVGSRDSNVYAFYENGTLKWNYTTAGSIDVTPIVVDDEVFVASGDWWFYKLDLDGNYINRYYPNVVGGGSPFSPASQAVAGDTIYYTTDSDSIIAFKLNVSTNREYWSYKTTGDNIRSPPAVAAGMLFFGSFDDFMYAFADGTTTNSLERTFALPDGSYEMRVISRDTLGNINESTVYFTVNDVTLPQIMISSPLDAVYAALNVTLSASANEPVDTWWYNLNGAGNVTFVSDTVITGAEGLNNLIVYANDTAGNINSSEVDFTVTLPIPATGIYGLLTHAGSGTGYFLDAVREPTVDIVLGLGIVGGIIAIFTGLAFAIVNMFSGGVSKLRS